MLLYNPHLKLNYIRIKNKDSSFILFFLHTCMCPSTVSNYVIYHGECVLHATVLQTRQFKVCR